MKKRIAIVLDFWDYSFNGTAVSTQRFIAEIEKQGFEFVILATGKPAPNKVIFKPFSFPIIKMILDKMKSPLALPDEKLIKQTLASCDLVHVQIPFFLGAKVIKIASQMELPIVSSFHVQPENILKNLKIKPKFLICWLYQLFIKLFYAKSDTVVCPSIFAKNMLFSQGLTKKTTVISNGIPDHFFFRPNSERYINKQVFHLLSVGRLAHEKHQDLIIKAVAASKFIHKIKLTLVGAGPAEKYIKEQAEKYLKNRCEIESVSNKELIRLYRHCDLFIHAGEIELEGMSVMEAMASGLPVVISDSKDSAANSFAQNPLSLFHFPSQSDLTNKIDYWLANPKARAEVAELNFRRATKYAHSSSCIALENIYRSLLKMDLKEEFYEDIVDFSLSRKVSNQ